MIEQRVWRRRLTLRTGVALSALVATLAVAPAAAPAAPAAAAAPVSWAPCTETNLAGLDCASYEVPLNYARPGGDTVSVALARRLADDQANRLGTIFVNPGGPGGPGRFLAAVASAIFQPQVLARYDVVGFDPRGIGASDPVECFATDAEAEALYAQMTYVPLTKQQIADTLRANFQYTEGCKRNAGPLLTRMSTLNVVRDLDRLRQGVGDAKLNYLGFSYGTLIGATYANVFPKNVGRFIIDGNVDPDQRTNNRVANKFVRAGGFETALAGFLAECDKAGAACAFSGGARTKFNAMRELLRKGPATLSDGSVVTIDDLTGYIGGQLYGVAAFPDTAATLQGVYAELFPSAAGTQRRATSAKPLPKAVPGRVFPRDAYSYNGNDSFFAVNCADAPLPRVPALYPGIAAVYEAAHRTFGRAEAFGEVGCANWPRVEDRYAGPWDRRTANTILVVNPTFDPATPYAMARNMARELGNARLLTMDGFGHTSQFSSCVEDWYTRYLLNNELPPAGTRCAQDRAPFPAP